MKNLKEETSELIKKHQNELRRNAEVFGGVFVGADHGAVTVCGADKQNLKVIFRTSFVSENYDKLVDAKVVVQDLLDDVGIEVISEHDFMLALEEA